MVLHFGHDITTASPAWSAAMSCVVLIGFSNWLAPPLAEPLSCAKALMGMNAMAAMTSATLTPNCHWLILFVVFIFGLFLLFCCYMSVANPVALSCLTKP